MWKIAVVSIAALSGCVQGPHVPDESRGDIPLVVMNNHLRPICTMRMYAVGAVSNIENWLGGGYKAEKLEPGASRTFQIKPGTYDVSVIGCDDDWQADTRHAVAVNGPTYISVGVLGGKRPAGYATAQLIPHAIVHQAQQPGGGGGDTESSESTTKGPSTGGQADCHPDGTVTGNASAATFCCSHMEKRTADNRDHVCCSTSSDNNECR